MWNKVFVTMIQCWWGGVICLKSGKFMVEYQHIISLFFFIAGRHLPFRVGVNFDANERDNTATTKSLATLNEQQGSPGGIVGFKLTYWQVAC